jgi:hypothetical protein
MSKTYISMIGNDREKQKENIANYAKKRHNDKVQPGH